MNQILLNKKMVKTNKNLKKAVKESKKKFGKAGKSVIKGQIGKVVVSKENDSFIEKRKGNFCECDLEKLLKLIEDNKLMGQSGSNFPVLKKLKSFISSDIEKKYLIINGVECEPGLVHDQWIIENKSDELLTTIRFLHKLLPVENTYVAAKSFPDIIKLDKKREAFDCLNEQIIFKKVPAKYPMGEEHVLIKQLLDKEFSKKEIPVQNGVLVMNVQTVLSIYNMLSGIENDGRYITIADLDKGIGIPTYVKYNENIKDKIISVCGEGKHYFAGSGIMNSHEIKDDNFDPGICFACIISETADNKNSNSCKGCGACEKKCPGNVKIKQIVKRKEKNADADISDLGVENCLHCNNCSFICAAQKNLTEYLG